VKFRFCFNIVEELLQLVQKTHLQDFFRHFGNPIKEFFLLSIYRLEKNSKKLKNHIIAKSVTSLLRTKMILGVIYPLENIKWITWIT